MSSSGEDVLASIEGIGPTIASTVAAFFSDPRNRRTLERLKAAGLTMSTPEAHGGEKGGPLGGLSFVFTGELEAMTRQEAEKIVKELGGATPTSVSGRTSFVVRGSNPGGKLAKAENLGVRVIVEKDFLDLVAEARRGRGPETAE